MILTEALAIAARRVFPDRKIAPATVPDRRRSRHRIEGFAPDATRGLPKSQVLQPGLGDSHVHFNDPGRSEYECEDFGHGTAAAAAGVLLLPTVPVATRQEIWRLVP